jgi:hypothetical protein
LENVESQRISRRGRGWNERKMHDNAPSHAARIITEYLAVFFASNEWENHAMKSV